MKIKYWDGEKEEEITVETSEVWVENAVFVEDLGDSALFIGGKILDMRLEKDMSGHWDIKWDNTIRSTQTRIGELKKDEIEFTSLSQSISWKAV